MMIRQEQLKARYKVLFPLNETKENLDKLLKLNIERPDRVFIMSDKLNTHPIFFTTLIKYIRTYNMLPSFEYLTSVNLNEIFFQTKTGDLPYDDLSGFKSDVLMLTYTKNEPNSKKSIELIGYLMDNYVICKHRAVWVFVRKDCAELENIAKELHYSIVDLDKILTESHKTSIKRDLF